jgi:antitoxin HicB
MRYPVTITPDDGQFTVTFPDVPEAVTFGEIRDEALQRAPDALLTIFDAFMKDRRDLPAPSEATADAIELPALESAKIELYRAMRAGNVGKAELARRLRWHLPQVDRVLRVKHGSQLDQMEAAFAALGKKLVLTVVDYQRAVPSAPKESLQKRIGDASQTAPQVCRPVRCSSGSADAPCSVNGNSGCQQRGGWSPPNGKEGRQETLASERFDARIALRPCHDPTQALETLIPEDVKRTGGDLPSDGFLASDRIRRSRRPPRRICRDVQLPTSRHTADPGGSTSGEWARHSPLPRRSHVGRDEADGHRRDGHEPELPRAQRRANAPLFCE